MYKRQTLDGYEMTKKGRGMEAVSVVTIASVVGGIIGAICLILFAPALGRISQMFSCLEYFLVACFGVLVVAGLTGDNQAKGIFAALLGLLIGCIGMDSISGVSRFTFGQLWLEDGLDSTPIPVSYTHLIIPPTTPTSSPRKTSMERNELNASDKYSAIL